jgi:hypothetical protein
MESGVRRGNLEFRALTGRTAKQ